ncbi:hypothetical protein O181_051239 [Austropuccinia psidii MF-1]|uniref:Uncharacterized protein n=1 Tax=Austropuccinia psidii MF-1 TaxID=1389203 RepID=A0A9Q3HQH9_9BASI|nr:hypothetical protein [Austropuccinia psidii MF-1]
MLLEMPVKHSFQAKNSRSQRHQAALTPTTRASLDPTPSVNQLSANFEDKTTSGRGRNLKKIKIILWLVGWLPVTGALMEARGPGTQESRTHLEGSKR